MDNIMYHIYSLPTLIQKMFRLCFDSFFHKNTMKLLSYYKSICNYLFFGTHKRIYLRYQQAWFAFAAVR